MSDDSEDGHETVMHGIAEFLSAALDGDAFALHVVTPASGEQVRVTYVSNMNKAHHVDMMRTFVQRETGSTIDSRVDKANAALEPAIGAMFAADLDPAHVIHALVACASGLAAAFDAREAFADAAMLSAQALEADAAAHRPGNA
jgi:hypothetical protein